MVKSKVMETNMKMYCSKCGKQLSSNEYVCSLCGQINDNHKSLSSVASFFAEARGRKEKTESQPNAQTSLESIKEIESQRQEEKKSKQNRYEADMHLYNHFIQMYYELFEELNRENAVVSKGIIGGRAYREFSLEYMKTMTSILEQTVGLLYQLRGNYFDEYHYCDADESISNIEDLCDEKIALIIENRFSDDFLSDALFCSIDEKEKYIEERRPFLKAFRELLISELKIVYYHYIFALKKEKNIYDSRPKFN